MQELLAAGSAADVLEALGGLRRRSVTVPQREEQAWKRVVRINYSNALN